MHAGDQRVSRGVSSAGSASSGDGFGAAAARGTRMAPARRRLSSNIESAHTRANAIQSHFMVFFRSVAGGFHLRHHFSRAGTEMHCTARPDLLSAAGAPPSREYPSFRRFICAGLPRSGLR